MSVFIGGYSKNFGGHLHSDTIIFLFMCVSVCLYEYMCTTCTPGTHRSQPTHGMRSVLESLFLGGCQEEAHSVTFWAKETLACVHTYSFLCLIEKPRGQHGGVPGQLLFRSSHIPKLPSGLDCYCDSRHLFFEASRLTDVIHPLHTRTTLCIGLKKKEKGKVTGNRRGK